MGISDLGLRNVSGELEPYVYNTSSVWGSAVLTRAESAYVDGDGPDSFAIQLNAVATNVTVGGVGGLEFWAQAFALYTPSTHTIALGDNVWNFSSAGGAMTPNAFAHTGPNGTVAAPYFYYAVGPALTVDYPFTLNLYLNASRFDRLPALYFNYSLLGSGGLVGSGSIDHVAFNAASLGAPVPAFQVNGTGVDPFGLPNDLELVLVGSGNGDTTTFFALNATLALRTWNASTRSYVVVPAAYDAGSDTGETSNGILPVYRTSLLPAPPTVTVTIGPSFVLGLWNVSSAASSGGRGFLVAQKPQNAFLFVSPGTSFNASSAQWVPTIRTPFGATTSNFVIPNVGDYAFQWLLSDHVTLNYSTATALPLPLPNSNTSLTENLTVSASVGTDTPLLAWGNAELDAIHQGAGNGTAGNPYVLLHGPASPLDPVFGQLNDLGFPVFAGVLLVDTSDYVVVVQPQLTIAYGGWMASLLASLGVPSTNELQLEFWNVTDAVVQNSTGLGGWLPASLGLYPAGELMFWGSSGNLVAGNTFHDQGVAVSLFGGAHNTVWGNTFLAGATRPSFYDGNLTTGIFEAESGDRLYNNFVAVPQPAITPTYDPASCRIACDSTTYTDLWNVSLEPANASVRVLGVNLTGSILRTSYQGGNYWSNYGTPADPFGVLPYNDTGRITVGGDYHPLYPSAVYNVTFLETGLVAGISWNETTLGLTSNNTTDAIVIALPNGTFNYSVGAPAGYVGPGAGTVVVDGSNVTVDVSFVELFEGGVIALGLATDWNWTVNFTLTASGTSPTGPTGLNLSRSTTRDGMEPGLENGTYSVTASAYGYNASVSLSALTVDGGTWTEWVSFSLVPFFVVKATGVPDDMAWTVTVQQDGVRASETGVGDGRVVFTVLELGPGAFTWFATPPSGYLATPPAGGSGFAPTSVPQSVTFVAPVPTPSSPGLNWLWVAIGALAALAAGGFALFALERRRRPRRPAPIAPASAAPTVATAATAAAAGPARGPTPWQETSEDAEQPARPPPWEEVPSDTEQPPPYGRRPGGT